MSSAVIVVHGGEWKGNTYVGGIREYIPIPLGGITFEQLLGKIECRLEKDSSVYSYSIHALVQQDAAEIVRMKITDDFEWSCLRDICVAPTIYVGFSHKTKEASKESLNHVNSKNVEANEPFTPYVSKHNSMPLVDVCGSRMVPTLQLVGGSSAGDKVVTNQWLIPGSSKNNSIQCEDIEISPDPAVSDLVCGAIFASKDLLLSAVAMFHLKEFLEYRTKRSDKKRFVIVCKFQERCNFKLRGKALGKLWKIRELIAHSCESDLRIESQPKVSSRALAAHVSTHLAEDGYVIRPRDIQGQMLREFGVNIKYSTALAGRNLARKQIYGDPDKSFQLLPSYLYMLEKMNPGSMVDLQTSSEDGSFQYCYFALDASIKAFSACRPVIVVDATHLKGKYKGVLFVASTKDANEQIVPLAFGVGDKEKDSSWSWFLQHVRDSFGIRTDMLIVSDQHVSIKNAIASVFPGVAHGLCSYHIQGKLRSYGDDVIEIFQFAANAYRDHDFDTHMTNLELTAPRAHARLLNIDPSRWARCKCPVRRYKFGTSNSVESLNSRLLWARNLPICSLLECARNMVQEWFFKRRSTAESSTLELSKNATKRLRSAAKVGRAMKVEPISDSKFNVISEGGTNQVDIAARTCSCEVFQKDLFPCSHASRAISHAKQAPVAYVHEFYTTSTLRKIYSAEVMPVTDPNDWCVPPDVHSIVVGTPSNPKQAGRPRSKRIQSNVSKASKDAKAATDLEAASDPKDATDPKVDKAAKASKVRLCTRCHQKGHYQTTCSALLEIRYEEEAHIEEPSAKRPRKKMKCGICGEVGHTRRKCTDPRRIE